MKPPFSYLLFTLNGNRYGVPVEEVRELVPLPACQGLDLARPCIVGLLDFRGEVMPVMDLGVRFGKPRQEYGLNDCIIILAGGGVPLGIIVNEVNEVRVLGEEAMQAPPEYLWADRMQEGASRFVSAWTLVDHEVVLLLDAARLRELPDPAADDLVTALGQDNENDDSPTAPAGYWQRGPLEDQEIFRCRAREIAEPVALQSPEGSVAVAVVTLRGESFGIGLDFVREFCDLRALTAIPCCPPHVLGQMNLRGEILNLLDIGPSLGLTDTSALEGRGTQKRGQVVVVETPEMRLGVLVEAVQDVMNFELADIQLGGAGTEAPGAEFASKTVPWGAKMLSILDMRHILSHPSFTVKEEVATQIR